MKYEVELTKHEIRRVQVFAESPELALQAASQGNAGFRAEAATELLDEDELGKTFVLVGGCECCGRNFYDGDKYVTTTDGIDLCRSCAGLPD